VCPLCGQGHLVARRGRYGPFVGCDRYPDCRYIKKDATAPSEQFGTCPKCGMGTVVTKRSRRGGRPFWGCNRYPDCDYSTWTRPGGAQASAASDGGGTDGGGTDGEGTDSVVPAAGATPRGRARAGSRRRRRGSQPVSDR